MIPAYLNNLQLPQVFASYTAMVDSYLQESNMNEHVVDSSVEGLSGFVTAVFGQEENSAEKFFSVENPSGQTYTLMQIDNGIIKSSSTKKCDCAIANGVSLCFIEFKANAYSNNPSTIQKNYWKAIEQLTITIGFFDNYHTSQGINFRTLRSVEAYICFRKGYPRSTSSQMNYKVDFAANNKIPLSFDRKKVLS